MIKNKRKGEARQKRVEGLLTGLAARHVVEAQTEAMHRGYGCAISPGEVIRV